MTEDKENNPNIGKSPNESIKDNSNFLRGTIKEGLAMEFDGSISDDDTQLTKFHGLYQQDDRDLRAGRRKKFMDKAYSFMLRVRLPGGVCSPEQWLKMDYISDNYANHTIKITTRQTFQFHGVIKNNLRRTMQAMDAVALDSIAACGDVNRNVMCNPNPYQSKFHAETYKLAKDISEHLLPQTGAYREIWLDGEKVAGGEVEKEEHEPLYGKHYLPRKFKTVIAIPPSNDVDIFAHCLGFIAIIEDDKLVGYNVTAGGGMGMTHGDTTTFPRTADVLGFVTPDKAVKAAEAVMLAQRDHGNRDERKHARCKYTVERLGVDKFREYVEEHAGFKFEPAKPFHFEDNGDRYGWVKNEDDGTWHCGLFIQNGRVYDDESKNIWLKTGLKEIAKIHKGDYRLTNNQNIIISNVANEDKEEIEALLAKYNMDDFNQSGLRKSSMACVALPTCGLALAESERYLPDLVSEIEQEFEAAGIREKRVTIRMTGCPNGCARPYLAEIGFVGTGPNKYNIYLGGAHDGSRLSKLYRSAFLDSEVKDLLKPIIHSYAKEREEGEHFGDYVIRKGVVEATTAGNNFHDNLNLEQDFAEIA
jgi:sulfite reductase (NADPH) hemoprotein beta-component